MERENALHIKGIRSDLGNRGVVEKEDIFRYYRKCDAEVTPTTVNWRIHRLMRTGVLERIGRGMYMLGKRSKYIPHVTAVDKRRFRMLRKEFPFLETCLWSTRSFREFMRHQPGKSYFLIEVEKDAIEGIFYLLKAKKEPVFIDPDQITLERYAPSGGEVLIVKPLITEAPVEEVNGVTTATLEKMLVDIYCDEVPFEAQQGAEMDHVFANAFDRYIVNESRLLRYAARRGKRREMARYCRAFSPR